MLLMRPGNSRSPAPPARSTTAPPSRMMAGAVDLGAVKARSEAAQRAASAPAPSGSFVVAATEANFQSEVLDRSFQVPVLIDLWAEWCEPCKQLSPVLEKLAVEYAGSWVLATVDIEANQRIAQMLQVQSIPTVFAVLKGQLVPGFQGALPEAQIREFLSALLDAGAEAGLTGPTPVAADADGEPQPPADEDALQAGDFDLAEQRYNAILLAEPANTDAALALGQVHLLRRLSELPADAISAADANPSDSAAQLVAADAELSNNNVEAALARLVATVRRSHGADRDAVRQRLVEYFELLGPDDPRVAPARRDLARALF
jgi:putative thioredoxin